MKLLRNPEVKNTVILYGVATAIALIMASFWDWRCCILVLFLSLVFTGLYLYATQKRYQQIAELSAEIDRMLHGNSGISLGKYSEGELSILYSEIQKMTVRLKEQQSRLQEDKIYLADSLADISHQIRTPLTSINLLVSLLSENDISEVRKQKLTHELYDLLGRIEWLITALLKISKLDAGTVEFKQEFIPLDQLIAKATAPLLIPMELRLQELRVKATGNFTGDISWTCEALTNIIKNCMEHTPTEGRIEIQASENALYTEIIISDNGQGIEKEDLPHIFERFYKGKNSDNKSFGIGLALARMIITSQNGIIKAEDNISQGTVFTIRFYKGTV